MVDFSGRESLQDPGSAAFGHEMAGGGSSVYNAGWKFEEVS
jgi:hypothetical protein